jgi:hypothetical protein
MAQRIMAARGLPDSPLDAAAAFHANHIPAIRASELGDDCVIVFDQADHTHTAWRLAMVQELAREAAPARVNAVAGPEGATLRDVLEYLANAPGVTGQVLQLDGNLAKVD